jgi:thermitase
MYMNIRAIVAMLAVTLYACVSTVVTVGYTNTAIGQRPPLTAYHTSGSYSESSREFVLGRVLVKFRPGASQSVALKYIQSVEIRSGGGVNSGLKVVGVPTGMDEKFFIRWLKLLPEVEFAELDYIFYPAGMEINDPLYTSQWHLQAISCPAAWEVTTGSAEVTLAVCDTGVDSSHPELSGRLVPGWNVVDSNSDTSPVNPHGTLVAGVAAAATNNALGVASPNFNCRIMPVRVSSSTDGATALSSIAAGVVWAADHGARVVNVGYAAGNTEAMREAGKYLHSKAGVLMMPAGNDGFFLSDIDSPFVFMTGSTGATDTLASFSNCGAFVDLSAPGVRIWSTAPGSNYVAATGSSFSSPLVASVAALMLAVNPGLDPARIDTLLKIAADDLGPEGWDIGYGWGRLNAARAVKLAQALGSGGPDVTLPAVRFLQPQPYGIRENMIGKSSGELVIIEALDGQGIAEVQLFADGTLIGSDRTAPYSFYWDTSALEDDSRHTLTAVSRDVAGNSSSISATAIITPGFDATPPQVAITFPKNGQNVGRSVHVRIEATDNLGGEMSWVELYANGQLLFTGPSADGFRWRLPDGPRRIYMLVCKAYDWAGNVGTSEAVIIHAK